MNDVRRETESKDCLDTCITFFVQTDGKILFWPPKASGNIANETKSTSHIFTNNT